MTSATERKIIRWLHILASLPIVGYIYGPIADKPHPAFIVKAILFPAIVLSGIWMWKGQIMKRWLKKIFNFLIP